MKIELNSIKFRNFLSYGSRWNEVDILPGMNIVLGKDKDTDMSNGVGKSVFLETIPFALYGKVIRDINKADIVNWKNRRNCEVVLNFTKGNNKYTILRAIKPDKFEIYKNDVLLPKMNANDYQDFLTNEIIGYNLETFKSLMHTNIKNNTSILKMKKPEKRKMLEYIFGLDLFTLVNKEINDKINYTENKIYDYNNKIAFNDTNISNSSSLIEDYKRRIRNVGNSKDELDDLKEKINKLQKNLQETEYDKKDVQFILDNLNLEYNNNDIKIKNINNKIKIAKTKKSSSLSFIEKSKKMIENERKRKKEIEEIQSKYGDRENIESKIKDIKKIIEELEKNKESLKDKIDKQSKEENLLSYKIKEIEKLLNKLGDNNNCPLCGADLKNNNLLNKKKEEYKVIIKNKEEINEILKKLKEDFNTNKKEIKKNEENLRIHSNILTNLSYLEKNEMKNDENIPSIDKIKRYDKAIRILENLINEIEEKNKKILTDINLKNEILNDINKIEKGIEILERKIQEVNIKIENEENRKKELNDMIKNEEKKIISYRSENKEYQKKLKKLIEILDHFKFLKELCKDENIKQYAISSFIPGINKRTNEYLNTIGHSFYTTMNNWMDITIKGPGKPNIPYDSLSGGESCSIDMALKLAMLDFTRMVSESYPDLIVFDELLDTSVDSIGITNMLKIVEQKQKRENGKFFIISHRTEIGELLEPDNVYFVEKSNGFSTITIR